MKKLIYLLIFIPFVVNAQKRIYDNALTSQSKRYVYETWGEFHPKPKHILGVQVNINHSLAWGFLSPNYMGQYKKGEDIRPLKSDGIENKRLHTYYAYTLAIKQTSELKDKQAKVKLVEYMSNSKTFAKQIPFWTYYFKDKFEFLLDYQKEVNAIISYCKEIYPQNDFSDERSKELLELMKNDYIKEIEIIKDRLLNQFEADMTAGKRVILLHEIYDSYIEQKLNFIKSIKTLYSKNTYLQVNKNTYKNNFINTEYKKLNRTDSEIMRDILRDIN